MNNNKILVVYNQCGLGNKERVDFYIQSLHNIFFQHGVDFQIVISSCFGTKETRRALENKFGSSMNYCYIDEKQAVNVTFNKTVQECVKRFGNFHSYLYVASDIDFRQDRCIIEKLKIVMNKYDAGMVSVQTDQDNGFSWWFGVNNFLSDFVVPLGRTCNLHAQLFSHDIYENYDHKILPDLFVSYCTESIFSFVNAAIRKKFVISGNALVHHEVTMDGSCSAYGRAWDLIYPGGRLISDIINDPKAKEVGMGYEEFRQKEGHKGYLIHDPSKFDDNGFSPNNNLRDFIKENFYLSKNILNYDNIKCEFK